MDARGLPNDRECKRSEDFDILMDRCAKEGGRVAITAMVPTYICNLRRYACNTHRFAKSIAKAQPPCTSQKIRVAMRGLMEALMSDCKVL